MSGAGTALVTWDEFVRLPDLENAERYELHDGQVVVVAPPKPVHIRLQHRIHKLLLGIVSDSDYVMTEFPYKPDPEVQFWYADVAYIPQPDWDRTMAEDYEVYAPPLIAEVLSPSNRKSKVTRQRSVAFSAGTIEFWVVDSRKSTVHVTTESRAQTYMAGDSIALAAIPGKHIDVSAIFNGITQASGSL